MSKSPIQISHQRLVQLSPIAPDHSHFVNDQQTRFFVYEIDDNLWQNVNPDGATDYELQSIKQDPARLPIGILIINENKEGFTYEGDLTVTSDDQKLIFDSLSL